MELGMWFSLLVYISGLSYTKNSKICVPGGNMGFGWLVAEAHFPRKGLQYSSPQVAEGWKLWLAWWERWGRELALLSSPQPGHRSNHQWSRNMDQSRTRAGLLREATPGLTLPVCVVSTIWYSPGESGLGCFLLSQLGNSRAGLWDSRSERSLGQRQTEQDVHSRALGPACFPHPTPRLALWDSHRADSVHLAPHSTPNLSRGQLFFAATENTQKLGKDDSG